MIDHFSNATIKALGYYVYVYSDPDSGKPFYVGKGTGNRAFSHLYEESDTDKVNKIKEIESRGKEPRIEILAHGLDDDIAYKVEAAAIDLIGIDNLTNIQRGHDTGFYGKIEASALDARYSQKSLRRENIKDNLLMIRINQLYHNGMSDLELYEATRGYWSLDVEHAREVDYVLAVYQGMVLEVYKPIEWLPAGTTFMETRDDEDGNFLEGRYEFVGKIANEKIRKRYVNKSVSGLFEQGNANPIHYEWRN